MRSAMAVLMAAVVLTVSAGAAYGGTSTIYIGNNAATLVPGMTTLITYTVLLTNGSAGNTTVSIIGGNQLSANDINVSVSAPYGNPTFSGMLKIYAGFDVKPGNYTVELNAIGADPSNNTVRVTAYIPGPNATTIATIGPTIAPTYTVTPSAGSSQNYSTYEIAALVIIVVAIIAAVIAMRRTRH